MRSPMLFKANRMTYTPLGKAMGSPSNSLLWQGGLIIRGCVKYFEREGLGRHVLLHLQRIGYIQIDSVIS
jgi:hypothetical protein